MEIPTSEEAGLPKSATQMNKSLVDDDFSPITPGKPFCLFLLTRSHVEPEFHMVFPLTMGRELPSTNMHAKIFYGGKEWETEYYGDGEEKRLDVSWKSFVIQNQLKIGDALHWEVMEVKKEIIMFKVQIIRGDFPLELCHRGGNHEDNPIVID